MPPNAWIKTASTAEQRSASSILRYANKAMIASAIRLLRRQEP